MAEVMDKTQVIAGQNDLVRTALADSQANREAKEKGIRFQFVWTPGVNAKLLQTGKIAQLATAIASFDGFTEDNDPYKQRDFFSTEVEGTKVFVKIDYYDRELRGGSEDPTDPAQTVRVITAMLPNEY
ncbi:hypothetical protein GCM10007385_46650 [Tateyamaria omphalii]|nr:hypothetical protein GCM10007385_46650 [Tateyamaria omphalii]